MKELYNLAKGEYYISGTITFLKDNLVKYENFILTLIDFTDFNITGTKYNAEKEFAAEIMKSFISIGLVELRNRLNMEREDFDDFIIDFARESGFKIDQKEGYLIEQ